MKTIVVPTDCSELSHRALRYADRIASRTGARVIAVYGERFSSRLEGEGVAASLAGRHDLEWMEAPIRQQIEENMKTTLSAATQRKIVIADADAAEAIVHVAERQQADLVIMGAHDRNRLVRAMLGSVTDTVLRETNRPVLILREQNDVSHDPIRTVLCPFRDSIPSRAAVDRAGELAQAFGAKLVLVHMVQDEKTPEPLPWWLPPDAAEAMQRLPIGDRAGATLIKMADQTNADLIVLGTSHRRFDEGSPTAPAAYVVHSAHCPVLTVTVS